jgi:hypothetical protein
VATTVEGTRWLTEDFCDGSEVYVARGLVRAIDLVTHRSRLLRAGESFFATGGTARLTSPARARPR